MLIFQGVIGVTVVCECRPNYRKDANRVRLLYEIEYSRVDKKRSTALLEFVVNRSNSANPPAWVSDMLQAPRNSRCIAWRGSRGTNDNLMFVYCCYMLVQYCVNDIALFA